MQPGVSAHDECADTPFDVHQVQDGGTHVIDDQRGFGAAEALIAMLLLAMFAVAFAPMLLTGLRAATSYTTVTTATEAVSEQLAPISTREFTCAEVGAWLSATPVTVTDPRGVGVHLHRSPVPAGPLTCTAGSTVTVSVTATDSPDPAAGTRIHSSAQAIIRIKATP